MPKISSIASSRRQRRPRLVERLDIRDIFSGDWRFGLLAAWLTLVFVLGGSSRVDIWSLQLLRPLSLLILAYGLARLTADDIRRYRVLLAIAVGWLGLLLLQLAPLPPAIWQSLGGRDVIQEIDKAAALGNIWRPLSIAPFATWNSFWASITPIAVLVLGAGLDRRGINRLVPLLIALGFVSAFVGLLQIVGDPRGPLYFYRYTHNGVPVGLLANRNHQAVLLASIIPMLAIWSASRNRRQSDQAHSRWSLWLPIFAGTIVIIPLILLTGSRAGIIAGGVALLTLPLLLLDHLKTRRAGDELRAGRMPTAGLFVGGLLIMIVLTVVLGRARSFDRLTTMDLADDMRVRILPTVFSMIETYMPWGSGAGTFQQVYRMHEPDSLLDSFYMNEAHNDWLDIALTGGIPALLLLAALFVGLATKFPVAIGRSYDCEISRLSRLGFTIIALLGLASVTDYPLRVPTLACVGTIAVLWAYSGQALRQPRDFASANV